MAATMAAIVTESFLIGILEDSAIAPPAKKRRVDREITGLPLLEKAFATEVPVHKRVLEEATSYLLNKK